jgi:hypothetical protein
VAGDLHPSETMSAGQPQSPPEILLVNIGGMADALSELVVAAKNRSSKSQVIDEQILRMMRSTKFKRVFCEMLTARGTLVANPRSAPQYQGLAQDGNPVAFFVRNFRLRVEAGGYYQTDLQRDSARLFNALRNVLKHKDVRLRLKEASDQLLAEGFEPAIGGRRINDIEDIGELLPARRGLEPRRPEAPSAPATYTRIAAE